MYLVRRFCPKCGKSVDSLVQTENGFFCQDCAKASLPPLKIGDRFDYYQCVICNKVSGSGAPDSWIAISQEDPQDRIRELILRLFLLKSIAKLDLQADIEIPENIGEEEKCQPFDAFITLYSPENENPLSKVSIFVKPHHIVCTNCSRRRGHYFTATVQIRGELLSDSTVKEKFLDEILKYAKDLECKNETMFVSKVVQERQGFDLQVSSRYMASLLSTYVKKRYGAKLEESKRLMGLAADGGEEYRHTIAVHLLAFRKNSIILFEGEPCLVEGINAKVTTLFGLERRITFRKETKIFFSHPAKTIASPENFLKFEIISEDKTFFHLLDHQTGATISEDKAILPRDVLLGSTIFGIRMNDKTFYFSQREV